MAELKEGDKVLYVADPCHWNDLDHRGERVFAFAFEDGPPLPSTRQKPQKGQPVQGFAELGVFERFDHDKGTVLTASQHTLRPIGPKSAWPATVVRHLFREELREATAVIDGQEQRVLVPVRDERLALEVQHPNGYLTLYYPLEGQGALKQGKDGHSWHREGE